MRTWVVQHFGGIAATWLIILVFAWSIAMAAAAGSRPSDWTGPLIGSVDWSSIATSSATGAGSTTHSLP